MLSLNKNTVIIWLAAGCLSIGILSCVKNDPVTPSPEVPDGKVRLKLYTNAADYSAPVTRAKADEDGIDLPIVLVFDGHGLTAGFVEAAQSEVSGTETIVTLAQSDQASTILLVANAPGGVFRNAGGDSPFTADGIAQAIDGLTLGDVPGVLCTQLLGSPLQTTAPFTAPQTRLPIAGIKEVAKIDDDTQLGTTSDKLLMTRSVAKATVEVAGTLSGFTLHGAGLVGAPRNGSIFRPAGTSLQANSSNTTHYLTASTGDGVSAMAPAASNTTADTPLYIYEAADNLGTALIIKAAYSGTDYYYKLAFTIGGEYPEILRNKN
ncbi:MAG: hypothetical protein LUE10_06200 [Alistipes sp.]|nr:hypothetical protein [Alistipes sp.]